MTMPLTNETRRSYQDTIPRRVLIGAAALIVFSLAMTATARFMNSGNGDYEQAPALRSLSLYVEDRDDGSVMIIDAIDRSILYTVKPGEDGFIRATLRSFVRERKRSNIGATIPFTLTYRSDGSLILGDSATRRHINLGAFGSTNARAFAQFFPEQGNRP